MAEQYLFPVFDVPEVVTQTPVAANIKYKLSLFFDFEKGDFVRNGSNNMVLSTGKDAYMQWCIKMINTERLCHLSYNEVIGVEVENANKLSDIKAVESALVRTITEALMVNPRTEYVRGFLFTWDTDGLHIDFTVKGKELDEVNIGTTYQT